MKTKQIKVIEPEEDKYNKKTNQVVGTYNDAPDFIKDNEYIKRGYRGGRLLGEHRICR